MVRSVNVELLTENIKEMCIQANHFLAPDMDKAMRAAQVGGGRGRAEKKD